MQFNNELDSVEFKIITEDLHDQALKLQKSSMIHENFALGFGVLEEPGAAEEMNAIAKEVLNDGCTVVAVIKNKVVAVVFNKIHVLLQEQDPFAEKVESILSHRNSRNLVQFLEHIEGKVNLYEKYNVKEIMEIFYIGTDPDCRGRGICQRLLEFALRMAREGKFSNPVIPKVAFGVFSSNISQRVAEKLNFEWQATIVYEDYFVDGRKLSDKIPKMHKNAKLGARRV